MSKEKAEREVVRAAMRVHKINEDAMTKAFSASAATWRSVLDRKGRARNQLAAACRRLSAERAKKGKR